MTDISLCHIDEITEGSSKGFDLPQAQIFAVKKLGKLFVYINRCPHFGIPLHWQPDQFLDPEGAFLQCSTHGALFTIQTGECIRGPCQGDSLWQVEYKIEQGKILIAEEELPEAPSQA